MNELIDISLPLGPELPRWPGSKPYYLEPVHRISEGGHCNESFLHTNIHFGTHIDAAWHFIEDGKKTDYIPLGNLLGKVEVIAAEGVRKITKEFVDSVKLPAGTVKVLFKTDNSDLWAEGVTEFTKDYVALTADAAETIARSGIHLVGIDYLSIQLFDDSCRTHEILLNAGVTILEGLNLHGVEEGSYELICLPLSIVGAEGAPARAVLRR